MLQTKEEYFEQEKNEIGDLEFRNMKHCIDNAYYDLVEAHVKTGNSISHRVYDSLSEGQRFHFNKHYNYRNDKVQN